MASNGPTPAKIVQLYKMVLKQAGSAVLYAKPAKYNLRALYRPEFDIWMKRAKACNSTDELSQEDVAEWQEFARRVQGTLDFLHRSSAVKGLQHRVISNMADMLYHMDPPARVAARRPISDLSTLSLSRPEFLQGKKGRREGEIAKLFGWDAFAEVASMAEGSAGIMLGKFRPKKPLPER